MGIVSEIINKGILHHQYPAMCPKIELSKEHQKVLNDGKCVVVKDFFYQEDFYVFKKDFSLPLSRENIDLRPVYPHALEINVVRQKELSIFYSNYPKYKP